MTCSALPRHVCRLLHCLCTACALSLEQITELCSEKNQNIKQSCRPVPHAEPVWAAVENHSTYKKTQQRFLLLSLLWTEIREAGMREGLVMAELETDLSA